MKTALIIIALLLIPLIAAQEEQPQNLGELETRKLIIEENAKVKAEIKQYIDRKSIEYDQDVQRVISENFNELDKELDKKLRKTGLKLGIIIITSIILGGTILIWIQRSLNKKRIIPKKQPDPQLEETIQHTYVPIQATKPKTTYQPQNKKRSPETQINTQISQIPKMKSIPAYEQ